MGAVVDLTWQRFGRLVAVAQVGTQIGKKNQRRALWWCICSCGEGIAVPSLSLRCGYTKSCGCLRDENRKTQNGLGRDAAHVRTNTLKHLFKLTPEMVKQKLETQNDRCSICRQPFTETPTVDHDHACCPGQRSCGKCVRRIICRKCNILLGHADDSIPVLERAIEYLRKYQPQTAVA